jgi:hypothetical protein
MVDSGDADCGIFRYGLGVCIGDPRTSLRQFEGGSSGCLNRAYLLLLPLGCSVVAIQETRCLVARRILHVL